MSLTDKKIGFAITGSFCTFKICLEELKRLCETGAQVTPILSYNAANTDTRFMTSESLKQKVEEITGRAPMLSIVDVEPIGPKKLLDLLIIAPCTGNTLAKLANSISDTPVTLAAKSHLRNGGPILIAVSTNDGLSSNAKNLGQLLNTKNIYFVPFAQDDYEKKRNSLVADMGLIIPSAWSALNAQQLQPLLV